ncbi:MAG: integrase core domain-containing protein [Desulfuromonas sp.]|nr:integrase core domain-containing protein [Desulfuromonas sp.]
MKYEEVCLRERAILPVLRAGLARWFRRYNTWRPREALGNLTPDAVCQSPSPSPGEAAAAPQDQAA